MIGYFILITILFLVGVAGCGGLLAMAIFFNFKNKEGK